MVNESQRSSNAKERIVHLDLKGAPPKLAYFEEFFKIAQKAGATGVLIEWEDMFPFSGKLSIARNRQSYSVSDVQQIIRWATKYQLQVIPLAQTAGHMGWILKQPDFADLREVKDDKHIICLTDPKGLDIVKDVIDQMMKLHSPYTRYFHIGADEVRKIGQCRRCVSTMNQKKLLPSELLLNRIQVLAEYIYEKHGKKTLIWHDMLDNVSDNLFDKYKLDQHVQPVVWIYGPSIDYYLTERFWNRFSQHFPTVWGASAFKGANGIKEIMERF
ncbi:unnamed protein product [Soboliphyme baturini]|uniref:beta-N-acetylhexosaminidase n=1 Tax=Soboliphyme baturini TaxID=241478 RepID=A0A183IWW3_9BILA|nr:unnamed protein product [Soboliphyme baturini]